MDVLKGFLKAHYGWFSGWFIRGNSIVDVLLRPITADCWTLWWLGWNDCNSNIFTRQVHPSPILCCIFAEAFLLGLAFEWFSENVLMKRSSRYRKWVLLGRAKHEYWHREKERYEREKERIAKETRKTVERINAEIALIVKEMEQEYI